jgi:hypothetical protein
MQEGYYMVDKTKRPHIFGLTASPIHGMNDTETSFAQLEHNLDSKVVTVRNWAEVEAAVPKCVCPPSLSFQPEHPASPPTAQRATDACACGVDGAGRRGNSLSIPGETIQPLNSAFLLRRLGSHRTYARRTPHSSLATVSVDAGRTLASRISTKRA